jgi:molybdate transport system substrate-binding protein
MKCCVAKKSLAAILAAVLVGLVLTLVAACGPGTSAPSTTAPAGTTSSVATGASQQLLIACASSMKEAFTAIGKAFDDANNSKTTFTFDASGTLQKQIEAGAPVDVFVSAAMAQVDNLLKASLVDSSSIRTFASNELVLAVPASSKLGITSFADLVRDDVKKITTGDPATAPHGKAAVEILTSLGILDKVQPKLIYAKNASQTLTYVEQGEVDAAIMFATDAKLGGDKVKVVATSDPGWHSKIQYVMAIVSDSKSKTLGQAFVDFLSGPEARQILQNDGFLPAPSG